MEINELMDILEKDYQQNKNFVKNLANKKTTGKQKKHIKWYAFYLFLNLILS